MVNKADLTQKCIRLEEHYQEEVSNLYNLTNEGIARIKSTESTRQEEYVKWLAQLRRVQGLFRQLKAILKEMDQPTCYSN